MHNIFLLLRIQFSQLQLISTYKQQSPAKKGLITVVALFFGVFLSLPFLLILIAFAGFVAMLGHARLIPAMSVSMTAILLFFAAAARPQLLFSRKDWQMLAPLPLATWQVAGAKFLFLYLLLLSITCFMMLPQIIFFVVSQSMYGFGTFFFLLLLMCTVPLIPLTLGVGVSILITRLTSRFQHIEARHVYGLFVLILILIMFFGQLQTLGETGNLSVTLSEQMLFDIIRNFTNVYLPSRLLLPELIPSLYVGITLFIFISLAIFAVFWYYISKYYPQIQTYISQKTIVVKKMKRQKVRTTLQACLHKEWHALAHFPTLLMNLGFSFLLAFLFFASLLFGHFSFAIKDLPVSISVNPYITYTYIMGFIILTFSIYASSSLSLEGKNIWIIETLPLPFQTILSAKLLTSLLLQLFPIVAYVLLLIIKSIFSPWQIVVSMLWLLAYAVFVSISNIWINFLFPKYHWKNEEEVIKQSLSSFIGTLLHILIFIILFVTSFFPMFGASISTIFICQISFFLLVSFLLFTWLSHQQLYSESKTSPSAT